MGYSKEQTAIISDPAKYIQVIAGAGSGKTHTMIGFIEYKITSGENPDEILVLTFSKKAAHEIKTRLEKSLPNQNLNIRTFHSFCYSMIQKYNPSFYGKKIEIISKFEKERILKEYFIQHRFVVGGIPYKFLYSETNDFLKMKFPELKKDLDDYYKNYKIKTNKLDFNDLVECSISALKNNEEWILKEKNKINRIIIDEFQDTDHSQLEWLKLFSKNFITVVGDDWQAIYGFRGATVEPFLNFKNYFSPCKIHFLNTNYRSLNKITQIAKIPISKNKNNIKKVIINHRIGEGVFKKWKIDHLNDLKDLLKKFNLPNIKILCRSNFRISEYIQAGFSKNELMTIHGSKGLEFETVILDCADGWNLKKDLKYELLEEERRILYVGLSRAKNNLIILGKRNIKRNKKDSLENLFFSYF